MNALPGILPIKMKDEGFYDEHSQTQRAIINMTLPYVENALLALPLLCGEKPFVIVDYGCAEGKNSVHVVNQIIETVRWRQQNQLFNVVFNDLPQNNFNKLFENIYKSERHNSVLTFASGQPFHGQVMPAGTVHFGYSASAAHWLTRLPECATHSHIYLAGAAEKEKSALAEIAARDWRNFLKSRAEEMSAGARLVITMGASLTGSAGRDVLKMSDEHKSIYKNRTGPQETYTSQIILDLVNNILQEFVQERKISKQQLQNVCFPVYPRNLDEVLASIRETELNEKLVVEQAQLVQIACPLFAEYIQTGDGKKYAQLLTEMYRAFMEIILLHQLYDIKERRHSARSGLAEQKIIDELFDRMRSRIQSKPEYYTFFPIHSLLVLARK